MRVEEGDYWGLVVLIRWCRPVLGTAFCHQRFPSVNRNKDLTICGYKAAGPKKMFCSVPVSDRPCQFMCDPNYFMSFNKKMY